MIKLRKVVLLALVVTSTGWLSTAQAATILHVNASGVLTGASGVDVNGTLYDVSFRDGDCQAALGACTSGNLVFTTLQDAHDAAQALLDQVFLDGAAGMFSSNPELIFGCPGAQAASVCYVDTPYAIIPSPFSSQITVNAGQTNNYAPGYALDTAGSVSRDSEDDTPYEAYAVWGPAGSLSVPEPGTLPLMAACLIAVFGTVFRKRGIERRGD